MLLSLQASSLTPKARAYREGMPQWRNG